jgi:hypothetical protein
VLFVESRGRANLFQQLSAKCLFRTVFGFEKPWKQPFEKRNPEKSCPSNCLFCLLGKRMDENMALASTLIIGSPIQESKTRA